MLDRLHAPGGEALAVADGVDLVDDRPRHVARQEEVGVQRVGLAALHRAARGHQRLPDHLPAEHRAAAEVCALSAEEVDLELLQVELPDELLQGLAHAAMLHRERARGNRLRR